MITFQQAVANVEVARGRYQRQVAAWEYELQARIKAGRHELLAALREAALIRDGYTCAYCGIMTKRLPRTAPPDWDHRRNTTLDHKVPVSLGGFDTLDNVVIACQSCNSAKGVHCMYTLEDIDTYHRDIAPLVNDR